MRPRVLLTVLATVALLAGAGGCSSSNSSDKGGGNSSTTAPASTATTSGGSTSTAGASITIQNFAFGSPLTVAPGTTVTVTNKDGAPHTVTADNGEFQTKELSQGQSGTFTAPAQAGTYKFHCAVHPNMHGTLTVQ
jgi:plastocyanin